MDNTIKSTVLFEIHSDNKGNNVSFTAKLNGNLIYKADVSSVEDEFDIFDCIEAFVEDNENLFRGKRIKPNPGGHIDSIKWTSNSTN